MNKKEGEFANYYPDGTLSTRTIFKNDLPHGEFKQYFSNGKVNLEGAYVDGKLTGKQVIYYETGAIQSEDFYKNNLLEGESKTFFENGKLRSISHFKEGKKHGKALIYDEEGTLILDMDFDMDNLISAKTKKMMDEEKEQKSQANNSVKEDKTVEQMKIKDEQKNLNPTK